MVDKNVIIMASNIMKILGLGGIAMIGLMVAIPSGFTSLILTGAAVIGIAVLTVSTVLR